MPTFVVTGSYTASAMRGMMDNPSDREAAARKIVEAAGGKLGSYHVTTGPTDFLMMIDIDDVTDLLAGLMVAGGSEAIGNIQTQRAFTAAEFTAMQQKAATLKAAYAPPG